MADLRAAVIHSGGTETDLSESKAAKRLAKKVNRMIAQADSVIMDLSAKEAALREDIEVREVNIKKTQDLQDDTRQEALEQISGKKYVYYSIALFNFCCKYQCISQGKKMEGRLLVERGH